MAATYIASLWRPTANPALQVAIITTTPQSIATQQTKFLVTQQQSIPHTPGIGTWIPHTIQPQPKYPPMVYPHATMTCVPHVPLFVQQPQIFNLFVQHTQISIPTLCQPQATSVQTSTNLGSNSYGSVVQFLVASEFNPVMAAAQPFNPYTQQYIEASPYIAPSAG